MVSYFPNDTGLRDGAKHGEVIKSEGSGIRNDASESGGSVGVIVSGLRKPEADVSGVES